MKSTKPEFSALSRVAGVQHTAQELETRAYLDAEAKVRQHINSLSPEERIARSVTALEALCDPADAEAVRAAYWNRTKLAARMVACMAGGYQKEKANDALAKFGALERGLIFLKVGMLIEDLQQIQKCMNGGHIGTPAGKAH